MKTNKLIYVRVIIFAFVVVNFLSCAKEKVAPAGQQIAEQLKFMNVNDRITQMYKPGDRDEIIIVSFQEWGRASKNCKGWGLCNANWFPQFHNEHAVPVSVPIDGGATLLEFNPGNGDYYFDILLTAFPPVYLSSADLSLKVDVDIVLDTQRKLGRDLIIKNGAYNFDRSLGTMGGYRIYLN